jgi:radical SAM protein with 4Fe4S-binding SPASM domain
LSVVPEIPLSQFLDELQVQARRIPVDGTLETTFRCNLKCVHCYVNEPIDDAGTRARELPLGRVLSLIDEIAEAGCLGLLLTGGEVLCRADFPEIYRHAVHRGLRVTVFTNGTMVTERIAALFAELPPVSVEITLYGMTAATYEKVTQVPGSFARCLEGIRRLMSRGVKVMLKSTILTWNEHELDDMRRFAEGLGVEFRHDGLLNARVDCGANRNQELQVPPERLAQIDLADPRRRRALERLLPLPVSTANATRTAAAGDDHVYTCGAGQVGFTVDPYGALQMCQLSRRSSFDLREGRFADGWNNYFPRLRERRWQTNDVCRSCTLLSSCGNCPGAAELEHGDAEGVVRHFCELAHARAVGMQGEASGHRADASCCLDRMAWLKPPAPPPLIQIGVRRAR